MKNRRSVFRYYLIAFLIASVSLSAQQVNTLYFLENVPVRHTMNPAFQPLSNFYLGFPALGLMQYGVGNNSFTLSSLRKEKDRVFSLVRPVTLLNAQSQVNLLDFGFRAGAGYFSFGATTKSLSSAGFPKELVKLLMYGNATIKDGQADYTTTDFDLKSATAGVDLYTEIALGYSRLLDKRWSVGAKLKYLIGHGSVRARFSDLMLTTGIEEWTLNGHGTINSSLPGVTTVDDNLKSISQSFPDKASAYLKPCGAGAGIDLGVTFKPARNLTIGASLTDLGFITWKRNTNNIKMHADYRFDGVGTFNADDLFGGIDSQALIDSLLNDMENSVKTTGTQKSFSTATAPRINLSAEYAVLNNSISFGLLSSSSFYNKALYEDITTSVNYRPVNWFNFSLSYSLLNGHWSNLGAGMGVRVGIMNLFFTTDYCPLNYTQFPLSAIQVDPIKSGNRTYSHLTLPYTADRLNVAFGVNFVFGNNPDDDKDGVSNRRDRCPRTPKGVAVDINGCPFDSDRDGVSDYLDECPDTPYEAIGFVDVYGCPLDTDGDGVPDYLDRCNGTPRAARGKVDEAGCLLDTDSDGIPDYLDRCPDTPAEGIGFVDSAGCLLDTDHDGVPDYRDKCPNTVAAAIAFVDSNGCIIDTDGDGVPDIMDKCPGTAAEALRKVDAAGCPLDSDGDGVPDYLDNCPGIAGTVKNSGCPEIKQEVRTLLRKALQGIQFESARSVIKSSSYGLLNQIATSLVQNPDYLIEVQGHTDNAGKKESNRKLSTDRANEVRKYLVDKGVDQQRIKAIGLGDSIPLLPNTSSKNKAANRRVEFIITFGENKAN